MTLVMGTRPRVLVTIAAVALTAVACSGSGSKKPAAASSPSTPPSSTRSATPAQASWPTAGMDLDNSRAAVGALINAANVNQLKVGWTRDLPGAGSLSTVPLVVGATVFFETGLGAVYAVNRNTGAIRWSTPASGPNIGPFGVAVDSDRVYALDGFTGIVAFRRSDGTRLWSRRITTTKTLGVDIQPIVAKGLVIASSVPVSAGGIFHGGDRGTIYALDAATGRVRWTFDTIKGDLWGHPDINSGGGAWYPPAVNLKSGLLYAGIGNPAPFVGTPQFPNGSSRPGPNLYTESIVALDLMTGTLKWYYQVSPHDLFDRDQVHALIAHLAGGRDVVISAGKSGVVVGLDPLTGRKLWRVAIGKHHNDSLTALTGPTSITPGTYGGTLTPPAVSDGVFYAATLNAPSTVEPTKTAYFGSFLDTTPGEVVALDVATGRKLWDTTLPGDPLGGATVVNDLVFTAVNNGTLFALNRSTGRIIWRYQAPGGINGSPAVVGAQLFVPVGKSNPPKLLSLRLPAAK